AVSPYYTRHPAWVLPAAPTPRAISFSASRPVGWVGASCIRPWVRPRAYARRPYGDAPRENDMALPDPSPSARERGGARPAARVPSLARGGRGSLGGEDEGGARVCVG